MFKRMRFAQVAVAGVLLLAAGCSSPLPWERDWGQSTSLARVFGQDQSPATAFASQGSTFPSSPMPTPGGTPAANSVSAATQSVSKAFKSAGDKVASALDVKPKVIPASDPAKLSSRPERLTPALYVQAAQLSENQGALAAAKQQYEKALELDPRDVNTLIAVARFHDRRGQADEALRRYHQARELAPANTLVWNDLGLLHARRGNLDASLEALQQAVRLDPRNVRYRNNLAAALIESKRVSEAVDVLRTVHPEATALFNAACLLALTDETQQAAGLLEQSLRIDPSQLAAREMLRGLRSSGASIAQTGRPPAAGELDSLEAPVAPVVETTFRSRPAMRESTMTRDWSERMPNSNDSARKLPAVE